ncbi:MAG: PxKF domain-containing protein [Planctomycetota bacterium]
MREAASNSLGARSAHTTCRRRSILCLVFLATGTPCGVSLAAEDGVDLCAGYVCSAIDDCHDAGICDPTTGNCVRAPLPDGTACNDFNAATDNDVCTSGLCAGVYNLCYNVGCPPYDDCHGAGTCDPATSGCVYPPLPDGTRCHDFNAATDNDVCTDGVCAGVYNLCYNVGCPPYDDCLGKGTCDPATSGCVYALAPDGTSCNDFNAMTTDDVCTKGVCAGEFNYCQGVVCASPDQCHGVVCVRLTGDCRYFALSDGVSCDDGDPDTFHDACTAGECWGIDDLCFDVVCESMDQCHDAACDPATGVCLDPPSADGTPCDDGWAGTDDDVCVQGECQGTSVYGFGGFERPIANLPAVNRAKAGASVVVKFRLGGDFGLDVLMSGYPKSSAIACGSTDLTVGGESTVSTGGTVLAYDPSSQTYMYHWKTDRSWKGSCRQLVVHLDDGNVYRANFSFD